MYESNDRHRSLDAKRSPGRTVVAELLALTPLSILVTALMEPRG